MQKTSLEQIKRALASPGVEVEMAADLVAIGRRKEADRLLKAAAMLGRINAKRCRQRRN
jgi:hypothetical protein